MATFQFTREEYIAASFGLAKKRTIRFIALVLFLIAAVATFRVISNNNLLAAAPYLFALLIIVPTILIVSKHRLGKTYDDQSSLRETFTADIGEEGVRYSHTNGTRLLRWEQIKKWSEDSRFIYLFESDLYARILPKRALSEEESGFLRSKLVSSSKP
jgi:hypothetical protein